MVDSFASDAALLTFIAASIASAMLLAPLVVGRPAAAQNRVSTEQWREDLRHFADQVLRLDPHPFHRITRHQFDTAVAQLDAKIPALSDHEIELELIRLVALLGEGRSRVPSSRGSAKRITLPNSGLIARISTDYWRGRIPDESRPSSTCGDVLENLARAGAGLKIIQRLHSRHKFP